MTYQTYWPAVRMILPALFDHLQEFFCKEGQFKKICPPAKTNSLPDEKFL